MIGGTEFARGLKRKGIVIDRAKRLVAGAGGVASAIAASLAAGGAAAIPHPAASPAAAEGRAPETFVGAVVMQQEITPLPQAARNPGCRDQVGTDMLFETIPAYLEFFGFGTTTPDALRAVARVAY